MIILGIESSSLTAGAAILEDDIIRAEFTVDNLLTHSQTLLPMIREIFKLSGMEIENVDAIAVSRGPGSFTGLRIGAATAKGLAFALNIPIAAVPTLDAMGLVLSRISSMNICPVMNAKRSQTYAAAYRGGRVIVPGNAYGIDEYLRLLGDESCLFVGDGIEVFRDDIVKRLGDRAQFGDACVSRQRASNVAILGAELYSRGEIISGDDFFPTYFRKPRAQREYEAGTLRDAGAKSLEKIKGQ